MKMFDIHLNVKITQQTYTMIKQILKRFPDEYESPSQVLRVGIIKLYREKIGVPRIETKIVKVSHPHYNQDKTK